MTPSESPRSALLGRIHADLGGQRPGDVVEPRHPVPLPARTAPGDLAWAAVAAASAAAARLAGARHVELDPDRVAVAYSSERHFRIDGERPSAWAPLSGFFRSSDGWVRTHGNYPHHAAALRVGLGLGADGGGEDVAAAIAGMPAGVAVQAVSSAGGLCVAVNHEKPEIDEELRMTPLIHVERLGDAPPQPLHAGTVDAPLRGIRVLDLTRVIAGPVGTRTLALLGADVLRIDPPAIPEIGWQHLDTGHGKQSAVLDLSAPADRARFDDLLAGADVVALGYRPGALDRLGLSPAAIAARNPGVIVVRHSAWGDPERRGFDSLVQAGSGIAWIESADGTQPGALPAQALDHSAGYLLAAAALTLLERRAREGGSWLAETSLRRVAAELLGMPRSAEPGAAASVDPVPHLQTFDVDGSTVTTTAPAIAYEGGPVAFAAPRPWGQDEPVWRAR